MIMETLNKMVMVVDDDPSVLRSITYLLRDAYDVLPCNSAAEALEHARQGDIGVVLSDIKMPAMTGLELLERIHGIIPDTPVLLMTAYAEVDAAIFAVKKQAFDFLIKPFDPEALLEAVSRAMVCSEEKRVERFRQRLLQESEQEKASALKSALEAVRGLSLEVVQRLTAAAECRDNETGVHIVRIGKYAQTLAGAMNLNEEYVQLVAAAGPMHDIGKIGIPDSILLKPGPLAQDEFAIMKTHCEIGDRILHGSTSLALKTAASIAFSHHERWDGTGYPQGLRGQDIPLEGRIVFLCDQYDALRSRRPYKEGLTHEETCRIILTGDGRSMPHHFDPVVLDTFSKVHRLFDEVFGHVQ